MRRETVGSNITTSGCLLVDSFLDWIVLHREEVVRSAHKTSGCPPEGLSPPRGSCLSDYNARVSRTGLFFTTTRFETARFVRLILLSPDESCLDASGRLDVGVPGVRVRGACRVRDGQRLRASAFRSAQAAAGAAALYHGGQMLPLLRSRDATMVVHSVVVGPVLMLPLVVP